MRRVLYRRFRGDALFRFLHSDESWIEFRVNPAALKTALGLCAMFDCFHGPQAKSFHRFRGWRSKTPRSAWPSSLVSSNFVMLAHFKIRFTRMSIAFSTSRMWKTLTQTDGGCVCSTAADGPGLNKNWLTSHGQTTRSAITLLLKSSFRFFQI